MHRNWVKKMGAFTLMGKSFFFSIKKKRIIKLINFGNVSILNVYHLPSYDHPHILAGQGTMGLEIIEQVPDVDAVVIPVGGGGLIAGAALAIKNLKPSVKIIVSLCGCAVLT